MGFETQTPQIMLLLLLMWTGAGCSGSAGATRGTGTTASAGRPSSVTLPPGSGSGQAGSDATGTTDATDATDATGTTGTTGTTGSGSGGAAAALAESGWRSALLRDHPLVGRIFALPSGTALSTEQLYAALARAEVVVLGEQHDNADHHRLQAQVIDALVARGQRRPVVFEQIQLPQQAAVDAWLAERQGARSSSDARAPAASPDPKHVDGLGAALQWSESGWPPWALYRPLFAAALRAGAGIVAGSMGREANMALAREGLPALDMQLVQTYRLQTPLSDDLQQELAQEMQDAHCGLLPERMLGSMVTVQRARDATLAAAVYAARTRTGPSMGTAGAVLIAGNGHARSDRGVPAYLRAAHGTRVASLAIVEVAAEDTDLSAYAARWQRPSLPFDYIWFTPAARRDDPCEALRKRFGPAHGAAKGKPVPAVDHSPQSP